LCYAVRERRAEQKKVLEEERVSMVGDRVAEAAVCGGMQSCPLQVESTKRKD